MAVAATVGAVACSGRDPTPPTAPAPIAAAAAGRLIVAHANGRPVFADCVATQAAAHHLDTRAALTECIDFELLAQAAETAGYSADTDVLWTRSKESVRALIRREFESHHSDPAAIPTEELRKVYQQPKVHSRYNHPEYRDAHFVRVAVARDLPRDGPADREAERRIRKIHRALAGKTGIDYAAFAASVQTHGDGHQYYLTKKPFNGPRKGRFEDNFARALFSIPAVGQVSEPTRTLWGWDLLLLARIRPPVHKPFAVAESELRELLLPTWRQREFRRWSAQISQQTAVTVVDGWPSLLPQSVASAPEAP